MKKGILILAFGLGVAVSLGALAIAEDLEGMNDGFQEPSHLAQAEQPNPGQGMPEGKGKSGKMHKMMGMMHQNSVVATSDGGVVVLSGPRLIKYDASLTLVKEVELPRGKGPGQGGKEQHHPDAPAPATADDILAEPVAPQEG